jgi:predicted Zn finger-like uncharacterized protein
MKIVCGSCQAKYSIADEKVAGKVFRIRCKRCGEVIVVRGDHESPEANATVAANGNGQAAQAPAAAAEAPSDAIWHVVINGEQAGPYSPQQLGELVASGQLDWEAYVWSEGFENWQPMRDVPDLVNTISGGQGVPIATNRPSPAAANTQMGADPFPEEAPAQQPVVFAKAAGGGGGGVVHTNSRAETPATGLPNFESNGPGVASSGGQGPRITAQQVMTGSRNENSVLFSLKNLQALATGSVPPPSSHSVRPGHAAGEGSGLIDIRALATTTGVEPSRNSEKDALLALGSAQGGAFGGLGSPMLSPPGKGDDEGSKKPLVFAIVGGCALLAIAVVAVAFIMRGGSATPAEVAPVAPAAAPAAPNAAAPPPSAAAPAAAAPVQELSEGEKAAAAAAAKAAAEQPSAAAPQDSKPGTPHSAAAAPRKGSVTEKAVTEPAVPAAAAKPAAAPVEKPKGNGSIDDLLNDAIGGKSNSLGSKPAAAESLPEKPSRDDVLKAMKGVTDAVKACAPGQAGVAFANVTVVGKTGRVGNVDVTGVTGEPGSCIARAVRKAVFPKFSAENFQVKFPFRL